MSKHRPFTLNQHDTMRATIKHCRNEIEKVKRKVARRSNPDDPTLQKLERMWYLFEDISWDLSQRRGREHSEKEFLAHWLHQRPDAA